jgi:hypothetical protein
VAITSEAAMSTDLEFKMDLEKFSKKIDVTVQSVVKKTALDIYKGVTKRTPVDTGALRNSWMIGINHKPEGVKKGTRKKGSGGKATRAEFNESEEMKNLNGIKLGSTVYITNNQPYAEVVEYGKYGSGPKTTGGYSSQAPKGMVRVTMQEVEAKMKGILG